MTTAQIALTVVGSLALVGTLATYLLVVARRIREIAAAFERIDRRVEAIDGPGARASVTRLNWQLEQLVAALPSAAAGEPDQPTQPTG